MPLCSEQRKKSSDVKFTRYHFFSGTLHCKKLLWCNKMALVEQFIISCYGRCGVDFINPFTFYAKLLRSVLYFYTSKSFSKIWCRAQYVAAPNPRLRNIQIENLCCIFNTSKIFSLFNLVMKIHALTLKAKHIHEIKPFYFSENYDFFKWMLVTHCFLVIV